MLRFVKQIIAFRKRHPTLMRRRFLTGEKPKGGRLRDIAWHGLALDKPLWDDPDAQLLAFTLAAVGDGEEDMHVMLNMSEHIIELPLPPLEGRCWYRAIDTHAPPPMDIVETHGQCACEMPTYLTQPHSVVVLEGRAK
jgi:isoamylase